MIINFVRGFMMALANSVPGVSGGTVAFLMGFYDEFINSISAVVSGTKEERKNGILFLLKIGVGFVVGFIAAILFLTAMFEKYIYQISSVFLGFIVFAIPIVCKEEKEALKKYINLIFAVIGIVIVFCITFFAGKTVIADGVNLSFGNFDIIMAVYLVIAGMIAVLAMVLPGISGSTLMLIMGLYIPILTAVKGVIQFDFSYVPACALFGIGILLGVFVGIGTIKKCLANYRSQSVYLIIGLMIGSIYAVLLGPTTLDEPQAAMSLADVNVLNIICFVIGGAVIIGLEKMKSLSENK